MEATWQPPQSPEDRFVRPESAASERSAAERAVRRPEPEGTAGHRTFYRAEGVSVTDRWLAIDDRRYAVDQLHNLRTVRDETVPVLIASVAVVCLLALAGGVAMVSTGNLGLVIAAPFLAAVPVGIALTVWRLRRRYFALYADYDGHTVLVFQTRDERRYNQICRALVRAREFGH